MAAVILTGWLLAGCTATRFGGRLVTVTLDSASPEDSAYLIPNERYLEDPSIATDKQRLVKYYRGKTGSDIRVLPYLWVYVVVRRDGAISTPVTFNPNDLADGRIKPDWP